MNLPGRENTKVPLEVLDTLTVPLSVLTRRCTNWPLADCVDETNCLNCSSALAEACAENSAALKPATAAARYHFFKRGKADRWSCTASCLVVCIDYSEVFPAGTRISRLPFDCMVDTRPLCSICSSRRAARL